MVLQKGCWLPHELFKHWRLGTELDWINTTASTKVFRLEKCAIVGVGSSQQFLAPLVNVSASPIFIHNLSMKVSHLHQIFIFKQLLLQILKTLDVYLTIINAIILQKLHHVSILRCFLNDLLDCIFVNTH